MTEIEFDHLLERFLWRDPDKMSFRELTCAFAIADYAHDLIWEVLDSRGHLGPSKTLKTTIPAGRNEDSPIDDGHYTDYDVDPVGEREFDLHLQSCLLIRSRRVQMRIW